MKLRRQLDLNENLNTNKDLKKKYIIKISIVVVICLVLFSVSLILKNYASNAYWEKANSSRDFGFFWIFYDENETVTEIWEIEAYIDASYYYEPYLYNFRFLNWNPYIANELPLSGYAYGPMFIYGMYFISLFVSLFNPNLSNNELVAESVKWSHITFDSLCIVLLYLIIISLKRFDNQSKKKHIVGFLGASTYMIMPLNLLYIDSLYLNIPQMAFFTMLALILVIKQKYRTTAFILTIAWLSKQMPLFLLAPWILIIWKKTDLKTSLVDFFFVFLATSVILSLPWMFLSPYEYFAKIFGPANPVNSLSLEAYDRDKTVTLAHTFLYFGWESVAYGYKWLNDYMIPFMVFYILSLLITYFNGKYLADDESRMILHTTWIILLTHAFISRGVYKYYDAFFTPFIILIIIVYLDKLIPTLIEKTKKLFSRASNEIKGEHRNKEKEYDVRVIIVQEFLFYILLIGTNAAFFYFNFIIITKSRFLHPLYILILSVLITMMFNPAVLKSLFKKENYIMLKDDIVMIFRNIRNFFKKFRKEQEKVLTE